ncbi:MAG: hypothetical protein HQM10_04050 [Candidatus Riflebacteria bacterium]|nr:hypothetical protein [Candidatus Riflebacteria bacterium]
MKKIRLLIWFVAVLAMFMYSGTIHVYAQENTESSESGETAAGTDDTEEPSSSPDAANPESDTETDSNADSGNVDTAAPSEDETGIASGSSDENEETDEANDSPAVASESSNTDASSDSAESEKPDSVASETVSNPEVASPAAPIDDFTQAYESWKGKGVRFVIRKNGKIVTYGIGKLESWGGKCVWVVRDPKGHFLTRAAGRIETWKDKKQRLVIRDNKGRILTHIDINLTGKGSFAKNVVGLRHLPHDTPYLGFVQESLAKTLTAELQASNTVHIKTFINYLSKNKDREGMRNFIPVLKAISGNLKFKSTQDRDPKFTVLNQKVTDLLAVLEKIPAPKKAKRTRKPVVKPPQNASESQPINASPTAPVTPAPEPTPTPAPEPQPTPTPAPEPQPAPVTTPPDSGNNENPPSETPAGNGTGADAGSSGNSENSGSGAGNSDSGNASGEENSIPGNDGVLPPDATNNR